MNQQFNFKSSILAGILGTVAMTLLLIVVPSKEMPIMNIPGMLATALHVPLFVGWLAHLVIGAILASGYAFLFATGPAFPGWVKGLLYGLIPWVIAMMLVFPLLGQPAFGGSMSMTISTLVAHLLYGAVVGLVYRPHTVHEDAVQTARMDTA